MSKTLLLMRHGEAGWGSFGQPDVKRSLTEYGMKQVHTTANCMLAEGLCPELIMSSTARRAEMSANILANIAGYDLDAIQWHDKLYLAEAETVFAMIRQIRPSVQSLLVVGHNPGLSELANGLLQGTTSGMATADMIVMSWPVSRWQDISAGTAILQGHFRSHA